MNCTDRVTMLEKDMKWIKGFLIYIAGAISIKFGGEALPAVMAMLG